MKSQLIAAIALLMAVSVGSTIGQPTNSAAADPEINRYLQLVMAPVGGLPTIG